MSTDQQQEQDQEKPLPFTMSLKDEECRWAHELKAAVTEDDDLKELSDFEYAQHAIASQGNLEKALLKVSGLQTFREEYNVKDTLEEGLQALEEFQKQQPWFVLDVEYEPQFGHFVCVYDYGVCNPDVAMKMPEDWRTYIVGLYYVFQLLQANIGAIREGLVHIVECEGTCVRHAMPMRFSLWQCLYCLEYFGAMLDDFFSSRESEIDFFFHFLFWKGMSWKNFNVEFSRNNWYHMIEHYPIINKEISWLHTSVIANMYHAFYKSMQREAADVIRVGCQFEAFDGRLDEVFKMPTPEVAEARLMSRYKTFLSARIHNQTVFELPPMTVPEGEEEIVDN